MPQNKLVSNTQIYLDSRKLLDVILDVTPNFPRQYKFTIGNKMHDLAVDLMSDISAAYINRDRATRIQYLLNFQSKFEVLKTLLRIAGERKWILGISHHAEIIELLAAVPRIRALLEIYKLKLSPTKFYIQHYSKGVEFTGTVVKYDRKYTCNRTIKNFVMAVWRLNRTEDIEHVQKAVESINSYLACLRQCDEYAMRRKILAKIDNHCFKLYAK